MAHHVDLKLQKFQSPEGLTLLEGWARQGLCMRQIAHNIGISRRTLYVWMEKYEDIHGALLKGKEVIDLEVERALLKNALGYEEERTILDTHGNEKRVRKNVPPNVAAQIFWLKNRRPDLWKDRIEQDVNTKSTVVISGEDELAD